MKVDMQTIDFEPTEELKQLVNEYIGKFQELEDRITGIDVYLKSLPNNEQLTKKAEFRLYLPGGDIFAEHQAETFLDAIQQAYKKARTQMLKRKDMVNEHRP